MAGGGVERGEADSSDGEHRVRKGAVTGESTQEKGVFEEGKLFIMIG